MLKTYLFSLISALLIMAFFFYIVDENSADNYLFAGYLTIACTYLFFAISLVSAVLYLLKRYFSNFLALFILNWIIVNSIINLKISFPDFHSFITSTFTLLDLSTFLIMTTLLSSNRFSHVNKP
jgi:hypothetical protein